MNRKNIVERFSSRTLNTDIPVNEEKMRVKESANDMSMKTYTRQFIDSDKKQIIERLFSTELELEILRRKLSMLEKVFEARSIDAMDRPPFAIGMFVIHQDRVWNIVDITDQELTLQNNTDQIKVIV